MIEINQNKTEQEIETEKYILNFLDVHGISSKKIVNLTPAFLIGLRNGLIIAHNLFKQGCPPEMLMKDTNILANYINSRLKRVKTSLNDSLQVNVPPVSMKPPEAPPSPETPPVIEPIAP